jgi:hypothetical protein
MPAATTDRSGRRSLSRLVPWLLRAAWIAVAFFGAEALDGAVDDRGTGATIALGASGLAWLLGVAAMAVPAVLSLSATRMIVPAAVPVALAAWVGGADSVDAAAFVAAAAIGTVVALSAETGRVFVQASAYGDEDRHLLRPPLAYLAAAITTWAVAVGLLLASGALVADRHWIAAAATGACGVGVTVWSWPRLHKLSRRWLVIVPVGLVVHDHLVLAETLMMRRQEIALVRLAPSGTGAADLTGPATGHALELLTHEPVTAILAATPSEPRGRAIHLTGCLVSPSRPGLLLASAAARRLPVGVASQDVGATPQVAMPPPRTQRSDRS